MARKLRALLVEDSEDDATMLQMELREGGYDPVCRRVATEHDLKAALRDGEWDIVFSDWSMPELNGLRAYRIVREQGCDLPFLIISGTIDEENAVEALRAGVHDFMVKGKFARLVPAIERELSDAAVRSAKRQADAELERQRGGVERSERLLRLVLESVPDGVMVVDERGHFVLWNPAAESIMRMPKCELAPEAWPAHYGVFLPDRTTPCPVAELPLLQALAGRPAEVKELFLRNPGVPNGAWLSVKARPLFDSEHVVRGAVAVLRDISGEKATHEQLLISDRMASLGMLAAGVGHEINNPLAAVIGNVEIALHRAAENAPADNPLMTELLEILTDARGAADRVAQIVRDLRVFARHEEEVAATHAVDIQHVLDSTVRMARNELRHRAQLVRNYEPVPAVLGSESRLGQVFLNLLVNAAQAITEGSADTNSIRLSVRRGEDGWVIAEVADTGSGISEEVLRHLFTPFFTTKPAGVGTGLGLSICQRIVQAMGGRIEVESEVGKGTTFRVLLRAADGAAAERAVSAAPPPSSARRRGRVLVIDDEPMIVTLLRRMLAEHEVVAVTDPQQAVERLRNGESFDVIFCDLLMPQMTGIELYALLARERPQLLERLVFMTGGAFTPASREFLQRVSNARLDKPFNPQKIRALLNARLS